MYPTFYLTLYLSLYLSVIFFKENLSKITQQNKFYESVLLSTVFEHCQALSGI